MGAFRSSRRHALRAFIISCSAFAELIASAGGGAFLRRDYITASNLGRPASFLNQVTALAPMSPSDLGGRMEELTDFYGGVDAGKVYLFSAWPTPDLRPYAWHLEGHPPLMLRPPGKAPGDPPDLHIEEVRTKAELGRFEEIVIRGFPLDGLDPLQTGALVDPSALSNGRLRCWVGYHGGRPLCASSVFVDSGVNNVTLVVTLPEARGRGFGEAITWRATCANPQSPALLLSSDLGRGVYERMGYLPLIRLSVWTRTFAA